jgi:hypothetical protein
VLAIVSLAETRPHRTLFWGGRRVQGNEVEGSQLPSTDRLSLSRLGVCMNWVDALHPFIATPQPFLPLLVLMMITSPGSRMGHSFTDPFGSPPTHRETSG